jgi:manganese oxidase
MIMGEGPFGTMEMGGMFTVLKVRDGITSSEDPGWYRHPEGTVAWKVG